MSTTALSQDTLRRVNRWKLAGVIALLISLFTVLIAVENLLVSSLLAFVIAYTAGPVVNYLERRGVSRGLATGLTFVGAGLLILGIGAWLAPYLAETISRLQADMPRFITGLGQYVQDFEGRVHAYAGPFSNFEVTSKVETRLTDWTHDVFQNLPSVLKTFFTVMVLGPFLAFFMIKDGRSVSTLMLSLVPNYLFEPALSLQHQINLQIGHFVRARLLESLIVAAVTTIGLLIVGFPYAVLLGLVAGLTNLIPYIGPLIGAVPAILIALVNGYSGLSVLAVVLVYVVAQIIDAGFLIPLMVAKIVDLHPVTVIIVIIAGAQLMGVLGMIISIPVASTLKVTVSTVYRHLIDTRT